MKCKAIREFIFDDSKNIIHTESCQIIMLMTVILESKNYAFYFDYLNYVLFTSPI